MGKKTTPLYGPHGCLIFPLGSLQQILLLFQMRVWPSVAVTNMIAVRDSADYPQPIVLECREKRRTKYINQLIEARRGE